MGFKRITISLDDETHDRLKQFAYEHHMTVSAAIKQWIWSQELKNENLCGQFLLVTRK